MLDFDDLRVFTKIVETGNLTRASRFLGLSKSTVSRRISRLEAHLGVCLLQRSTRAVTVTQDGETFFEYCRRSIGILQDGERFLQSKHRKPQGVVRMAVPYVLGRGVMTSLMTGFAHLYPDVRIVIVLSDDPLATLQQGFDVALAAGPLADSGLTGVKIGTALRGLYGAPEYFERKGGPQSYKELARFDLLALGQEGKQQSWRIRSGVQRATVDFVPFFSCNDTSFLRELCLAGLGIATMPSFLCGRDVDEGRLVDALPGWHGEDAHFFVLFPNNKATPARTRALIDFLVESFPDALSQETLFHKKRHEGKKTASLPL